MHHSVCKSTSRFTFPEGLLRRKAFCFFAFIHHTYILQQNIKFIAFLLLNFIFTHWWASHTSYTIYNILISYNHARRYWEQYTCVIWVYKTITMSFVLVFIFLVKLHLNNRFRQFLICTSRQILRGLWQDIIANLVFSTQTHCDDRENRCAFPVAYRRCLGGAVRDGYSLLCE